MTDSRRIYPAILFASAATLGFEILLVRVFSIILWYHFAFMVVSIAMLGLAASGTLLALLEAADRRPLFGGWLFLTLSWMMVFSYGTALRVPFDPIRLSWDPLQILNITLYYASLAPPFFLTGYLVATALMQRGKDAGIIYGADLTGAALGVVFVLTIQHLVEPAAAVFLLATVALPGAFILGGGAARAAAGLSLVLFVWNAAYPPGWSIPPMSPYKELPSLLRYPGTKHLATRYGPDARVDLIRGPGVRHAPGLSLTFTGEVPEQVGLAVDGGDVSAMPSPGTGKAFLFLDYLPTAAPYVLRKPGRVLLLNPRNGYSRFLAERFGSSSISEIESNPTVARVLREFGDAPPPGSAPTIQVGTPQALLRQTGTSFDLLHLSLAGTIATAASHGFEDYRFTREAVDIYLSRLAAAGLLAADLYLLPPYRTEFRLLATIAESLEGLAATPAGDHLAVLRSIETLTILASSTPFTPGELERLNRFADRFQFEVIWPQGKAPTTITGATDPLRTAIASILADTGERERFIRDYLFDIAPVTNDKPFFFYNLRIDRFRETLNLVDGRLEFFVHEGYITPFMLIQETGLGILLVLIPVALASRRFRVPGLKTLPILSYFGLLGLAYMFVELALLQNFILLFETPTRAMGVILGSLLVSSGVGSILGSRLSPGNLPRLVLLASIASVAGAALLPTATNGLMSVRAPLFRASFAALLVGPLGLLMGMPFPGAVRLLTGGQRRLVPWAWAVNGFFSVLGPVLGIMLAARYGYSGIFALGALAYGGAWLLSLGFSTSPIIGTKATPPI